MAPPESVRDRNVCIVGMGNVGVPLAVAFAQAGCRVFGVDRDPRVVDCLRGGRAPFFEAELDQKLAQHISGGSIVPGAAIPPDCPATVFIVAVPTPVDSARRTQFDALRSAAVSVAQALKAGDLVVLRSTVPPGTTRGIVKPILDKRGVDYGMAYCPDRTIEGNALAELGSLPQIVGGLDDESTLRAAEVFSGIAPSIVRVSSVEAAEAAKLISNTQREMAFAYANEVALLCEAAGISAREVINAVNRGYPRANLALPGPVGGACLSKDSHLLAEAAERLGFSPLLTLAARAANEALPERTIKRLAKLWRARTDGRAAPAKIAILGLAYKGRPATSDLRGTMAIPIIRLLAAEFPGARLAGFDPVVAADAIGVIGVEPAATIEDAFAGASLVVIQNNHEFFARMALGELSQRMAKPGTIYDYWCQFDGTAPALADGIEYLGFGNAGSS